MMIHVIEIWKRARISRPLAIRSKFPVNTISSVLTRRDTSTMPFRSAEKPDSVFHRQIFLICEIVHFSKVDAVTSMERPQPVRQIAYSKIDFAQIAIFSSCKYWNISHPQHKAKDRRSYLHQRLTDDMLNGRCVCINDGSAGILMLKTARFTPAV